MKMYESLVVSVVSGVTKIVLDSEDITGKLMAFDFHCEEGSLPTARMEFIVWDGK